TRPCCGGCCAEGPCGRLLCALYEAVCCPDPCYEPRWVAGANSAFFVDTPRPVTQTTLRWDHTERLTFPDRAEYVWAQIGGKGPAFVENHVNIDDLVLRIEAAANPKFSFFVDAFIYRSSDPEINGHGAGFGDMSLGTKSVLLDTEMLLTTFQFKVTLPTG